MAAVQVEAAVRMAAVARVLVRGWASGRDMEPGIRNIDASPAGA